MACDLCSKQGGTVLAKIEGTAYRVCQDCAKYGEVIAEKTAKPKRARSQEPDLMVVKNASSKIRSSRQRKGLTQDDLAKNLAVKVSQVHAWESGSRLPTVELAKRLEKYLGTSLLEEARGGDDYRPAPSSGGSLTIADLLKKK